MFSGLGDAVITSAIKVSVGVRVLKGGYRDIHIYIYTDIYIYVVAVLTGMLAMLIMRTMTWLGQSLVGTPLLLL